MSSAPSSTLRLIAALERAGHTRTGRGEVELPDRRATRTQAPAPSSLTLLAIAQNHEANVAAYVERRGGELEASGRDRAELFELAGAIAETSDRAARELAAIDLADSLLAALTAGQGHDLVTGISCPQCLCWSLLAIRSPEGWRAACRNQRCATPGGPRTFPLRHIAEHHLRETRAA